MLRNPAWRWRAAQVLVVLEAMKTVFRLGAPADGVVASVSCRAGDAVEEGQVLVSFAEERQADAGRPRLRPDPRRAQIPPGRAGNVCPPRLVNEEER